MGWTCRSISCRAAASPRAFAAVCRVGFGTERVPREPSQRRGERCSLLEARQRLGDGGPHCGQVALPCRQFGDRRQRGKPVGRVAAGRGVDLARQSEAFLCCVEPALVRVDAGSIEMEPGRGTTDRIQLQPLIGCRRSLVPAAEIEQGLGDVAQEDATVRAGHAKPLRDRESLAGGLQRRLGAPDPIEQGGEVGVPERDPFDTAESLGDRQPTAVRGDPAVHVAGQGLGPAEDAERQGLLGRRADGLCDLDRITRHRRGPARVAAQQPKARCLGEDPGPSRRRGLRRGQAQGFLDGSLGGGHVA